MLYCSQEKATGTLLFLEGDRCTNVFIIRKLVLYCSQEKGTGALLSSGEWRWGCSVLWRTEVVLYQVYWSTVMKVGN